MEQFISIILLFGFYLSYLVLLISLLFLLSFGFIEHFKVTFYPHDLFINFICCFVFVFIFQWFLWGLQSTFLTKHSLYKIILYHFIYNVSIYFSSPRFCAIVPMHFFYTCYKPHDVYIFTLNEYSLRNFKSYKMFFYMFPMYLPLITFFIPFGKFKFSSFIIFPLPEESPLIFLIVQVWQQQIPLALVCLKTSSFHFIFGRYFYWVQNSRMIVLFFFQNFKYIILLGHLGGSFG